MKNILLLKVIVTFAIFFLMGACVSSKVKKIRLHVTHKGKLPVNARQQKVADSLHAVINYCTSSQGCGPGDPFCTNPGCEQVIMNCHRIDEGEFNDLTNSREERSNPFPRTQIKEVLNKVICTDQKIKCYRYKRFLGNYFYCMKPVPITGGKKSDTYYSYPLLQGIYNAGADSIKLYNATHTSDGHAIIPIEVFYPGRVEYFDLSNDFP